MYKGGTSCAQIKTISHSWQLFGGVLRPKLMTELEGLLLPLNPHSCETFQQTLAWLQEAVRQISTRNDSQWRNDPRHPLGMPLDLHKEKCNRITSQWPPQQRGPPERKEKSLGRKIRIRLDPKSTQKQEALNVKPGLQVHSLSLECGQAQKIYFFGEK